MRGSALLAGVRSSRRNTGTRTARGARGPRRQGHRRAPWTASLGTWLVAAAIAGTAGAALSLGGTSRAGAATPVARVPRYYLALGASESLGVQPLATGVHGAPTDDGYANAVLAMERTRWPGLRLVHAGCSGITVQAALFGGGRCSFAAGSEVATATAFLRAHPGRTVLATVDLGFNDLWPCLVHRRVDQACVTAALRRIHATLPIVLHDLRTAGGPRLTIVGLLHNDPYLGAYLRGPSGRRFSSAALSVVERFNTSLRTIYGHAGARVANIPSAFALGTSSPTKVTGHGSLPRDVAKVCTLSWMCSRHNIHLNVAGYNAIASAIAAALPAAPRPV